MVFHFRIMVASLAALIVSISLPAQVERKPGDHLASTYTLEGAPIDLLTAQTARATAEAKDVVACEPRPLIALGRGYNSLTGCFRGNSVQKGKPSPFDNELGQHVEYSLTEIESTYDLRTYLGYSAASSFDAFAVGGNFSSSYTNELEIHRYSSYLLVLVEVTNSTSGLDEFALREDVRPLAGKLSPDNFLSRFGDTFVASMTTGGRFVALVEFLSEDRSHQEATQVDLKTHAGKWEAAVTFQDNLSELSKNSVTRIKVHKDGGIGSIPKREDLVKAALDFPNEVNPKTGHPVIYSFSPLDYRTTNWPVDVALPPTLDSQKRIIEKLSADRDKCQTLKDDINYVLTNPKQFGTFDAANLKGKLVKLDGYLKSINDSANSVLENPLSEISYPAVDYDQIEPLPERINSPVVPLRVHVQVPGIGEFDYHDKEWAGITGQHRAIQTFSAAVTSPDARVGIEYDARYFCVWAPPGQAIQNTHAANGELLPVPRVSATNECFINAISFHLTGEATKSYDIFYAAHFRAHGDSQVARNGDQVTIGTPDTPGGRDIVEAIKVWILPREN